MQSWLAPVDRVEKRVNWSDGTTNLTQPDLALKTWHSGLSGNTRDWFAPICSCPPSFRDLLLPQTIAGAVPSGPAQKTVAVVACFLTRWMSWFPPPPPVLGTTTIEAVTFSRCHRDNNNAKVHCLVLTNNSSARRSKRYLWNHSADVSPHIGFSVSVYRSRERRQHRCNVDDTL